RWRPTPARWRRRRLPRRRSSQPRPSEPGGEHIGVADRAERAGVVLAVVEGEEDLGGRPAQRSVALGVLAGEVIAASLIGGVVPGKPLAGYIGAVHVQASRRWCRSLAGHRTWIRDLEELVDAVAGQFRVDRCSLADRVLGVPPMDCQLV